MQALSAISLYLTFAVAYGSLCTDLTGTWKNQLNSNMTIENVTGNTFTGTYHTAVVSSQGAARITSKISGMIRSVGNGKLIGFNVLWNKGASLTAWVGQCLVCDGKEKISTTWVLRSYLPAKKRWMSTRINQDTFWRLENSSHAEPEHESHIAQTVSESGMSDLVTGKWVTTTASPFEIQEVQEFGAWKGLHYGDGHGEDTLNEAVGRFDGNQTYTAVGFVSTSTDKIRGWAGHIDNTQTSPAVMETTWLEHTFHDACTLPRKHVQFGMDNFSKD